MALTTEQLRRIADGHYRTVAGAEYDAREAARTALEALRALSEADFRSGYGVGYADGSAGNPDDPDLAISQYRVALAAAREDAHS